MKKKILILLVLMFFSPFLVNAKGYEIEWQKSYGGNNTETFTEIVQLDDGSFLVLGHSRSTDIDGLINKGDYDCLILKYDKDGNLIWQKSWGGNGIDTFSKLLLLDDGSFIVTGSTSSTDIEGLVNKGSSDAVLIKYDENGNLIWQKNWGGNDTDSFGEIYLDVDGYIILGHFLSTNIEDFPNNGNTDIFILKVDFDGNEIWKKSFGGNKRDSYNSSIMTKNKEIIIVGETSSTNIEGLTNKGGSDAIILKYDVDGNLIFKKNIGGESSDSFRGIALTEDSSFVTVAQIYSKNDPLITTPYVTIKFDKNGDVVWINNYHGPASAYLYSIKTLSNSNLLAIGDTAYGKKIEEELIVLYEGLILLYDKNGNIIEEKIYGGSSYDYFHDFTLVNDKDFVVIGRTLSTDIEGLDVGGTEKAILVKYKYVYDIYISETINGNIDIEQKDNKALITPTPNEGYEVEKVIVKDTASNEIEVAKLENGTYSFELTDDMTVEVLFKEIIENPKTGISNMTGLIFTIALCFISALFVIKKYNKSYEI